jgi:hypothetical protein
MRSDLLVTIADPLTIPVINVLSHVMKQRSLRPKRHAQNLMMGVVLVVVVVGVDMVMVEEAVGVTVPILGVNGVPTKVILLLPVLIHLRVMVPKSEMESG